MPTSVKRTRESADQGVIPKVLNIDPWRRLAKVFGQERVASRAMRDAARMPWEAAVPVARAIRRRASGGLADAPRRRRPPSTPADVDNKLS